MGKLVINEVVNFQAFILAVHSTVYGLPALEHEHLYFVTIPRAVATNEEDDDELSEETMELKCN